MKLSLSQILLLLGLLAALGPGTVIPNDFDMLWRVGGSGLLFLGWLLYLGQLRKIGGDE